MINMIRADMYRILRGKALYITFAVLILLNIMVVGTMSVSGINFGNTWDDMGIAVPYLGFDGLGSAALLYTRMDNIVFILLPLVYAVVMPIFANSTIKNDIASGASRPKLYISKLALSAVLCVVMIVFYMGTGMLLATVLRGFGGPAPVGYWVNLLQTVGAQLFIMLAVTCFAVFLMFTLKSGAAVNSIFIAYFFVPTMVIMLLYQAVHPWFIRLMDFLLMFSINRLGFLDQLSTGEVLTALGVGLAHILVCTLGGIMLFKRAEIK